MPRAPRSSRLVVLLLALAVPLAGLAAGCGSGGGDGDNTPAAQPQPTAKAEDFPSSKGRTLPDMIGNLPGGPVLAPSVSVLQKGTNRIGFAPFDTAGKQLSGPGAPLSIGAPEAR